MTREEYIKFYDAHYKLNGIVGAGTGEWERKKRLWQEIGWHPGLKTLDYGCGAGAMANVCDPKHYLGVDIAEEAIRLAKLAHPAHNFRTFTIGSLQGEFDFVAAMSVFTHCRYEDLQDCLRDIKNSLKPKGFGLVDILVGEKRETIDAFTCFYPVNDFLNELMESGFRGEKVGEISWPSFTHTYFKVYV